MIKGLALSNVLYACYYLTLGAGACLNPAFGMAQTTYWVAMAKENLSEFDATCIWVYMAMPFIGAIIAAIVFSFHSSTSSEYTVKENEDECLRDQNDDLIRRDSK